MYVYHNKETNELKPFKHITDLCKYTGLKKDRFYTHFGRKKKTEFENNKFRIVKD